MAIKGALKSVRIVTADDLRGAGGRWKLQEGPAIKVRGYTEDNIGGRKVQHGDAQPVYVLGENDIRQNGGLWRLKDGQPIPVTDVIGDARGVIQGKAIPVYPVDDDGVYDSSFVGEDINAYRDKVLGYNPTIYYMMSEDVGAGVAVDSSGNGLNGNYANVTLGLPGIGDGRTACDFNGVNSILTSPNIGAVFDGDEYSIAFWMQCDDWTTDFQTIMQWFFDGNNSGDISIFTTDGWLANDRKGGGTFKDAKGNTGTPPGTTWLYVAATVSVVGNIMLIYFDAVVQADTGVALVAWVGAENQFTIGARAGVLFPWDGRLQHFAIWYGTVLTQPQITDLATFP